MAQNRHLHTIIYFLIFISGWLVPSMGLPPAGTKIISVFLALIYGWTFIGFTWPSIFTLLGLGFSGYADPGAIFVQGFGHPAIIFTFFIFIYTKYCDKSGLNEYMARWLLSRSIFVGRPWIFTYCIMTGAMVIGFLIDALPAVFLIFGILYNVFSDVGYKRGDAYTGYLTAGVIVAGVLSFVMKPWGGQNLFGLQVYTDVSGGAVIPSLTLMAVSWPVCLLTIFIYTLVMRYVLRLDVKPLTSLSEDYFAKIRAELKMTPEAKLAGLTLLVFLALMLGPNIFTKGPIHDFFAMFPIQVAMGLILGVLCLININKKPVFNFQECASSINWDVVWMMVAAIMISSALSSKASGLGELMTTGLQSFSPEDNPITFVSGFTLLGAVATQFTHNITILVVGMPIIWNISQVTAINPEVLSLMLILGAGGAYATPAASTVGALMFANTEWIGVKRAYITGILCWLAYLVCTFAVGLPLILAFCGKI